jgi:hypothetical protein
MFPTRINGDMLYSVGRKSGIAGFSLTDAINEKREHRAMQIYRPMV